MITDASFYKGSIAISNAEELAPNPNLGNRSLLERAISQYERDVLVRLFGYDLFKLFEAQFDVNSATGVWTIKGTADAKWGELLNGKEYTNSGLDVTWRGLIFTDGGTDNPADQSLLAYYVYTKYLDEDGFSHSGTGMQSEEPKNSVRVNSRSKWVEAWNDFYEIAIGNYTTYTYEHHHHYHNMYPIGLRSLYEFLTDMNALDSTTYPNWNGELFELKNRYL